jgi:hypothetical protein|uniref:AMIN domain-containing protein n=1 Tax=Desulfobacca acetoxidans TaxID=60893 RepID=A0A7C3V476_9BACT
MKFSWWTLPAMAGRSFGRKVGVAFLLLWIGSVIIGASQALALGVEVRNLGLSRVGERTMLTVLLSRPASPRVSPYAGANQTQLVVEFPQASAAALPPEVAGDQELVKDVKTEVASTGVKIILNMFPGRPYLLQKETVSLKSGAALFQLSLRPDFNAPPATPPPATAYPAPPEPSPQTAPGGPVAQEETPAPAPYPEPAAPSFSAPPPSGEYAEIYRLIPQARGLWDFLRRDGWTVAKSQTFDSPGKRLSQAFTLTNSRFPDMSVRIAHVPPSGPGAPAINIVDLAMDRLTGGAADEYRMMRHLSFGQIRSKYEDIGDFFEDALKPLRVEIRKKCQELAERRSLFITDYLRQAVPQKPGLADEVLARIRKKVSPRFEGVQYTLSEHPLTILNLVDFTYIRIYYLGG